MGDELSRTQKGNNNAFCQDNEMSWLDWNSAASDPDLAPFTATLLHLRRRHEAFRRRSFLTGERKPENSLKDVYWLAPEAREMTSDDWNDANRRVLGVQIGNDAPDGERFLILINAAPEPREFRLHQDFPGTRFVCVFDTKEASGVAAGAPIMLAPGGSVSLDARSLMLFQHAAQGARW
jgi:isoamylase